MGIIKLLILRLWLPVVLVGVWWIGSANSTSPYFPPLATILERLFLHWLPGEYVAQNVVPSLTKFAIGFSISVVLGVLIGIAIGASSRGRWLLDPIVQFLRSLPPPVFLPIGLVLFGIGASMNVFIIVIGSIWPTILNAADGVTGIDRQVRDMTRSYGVSGRDRFRYVYVPAAMPQILAGVRTTLQLSIILIVISEMVGATSGIGFELIRSQQTFNIVDTWAGTVLLGVFGFLATQGFLWVERRVIGWKYAMSPLGA